MLMRISRVGQKKLDKLKRILYDKAVQIVRKAIGGLQFNVKI
jgi:hypothetical protein